MKILKKQNIEYAQQLKDVMLHWNQLFKNLRNSVQIVIFIS